MKIQKELIEKYVLLLLEYIHLVNSSEIIPQLENASVVFQIGANALMHIYKLAFLITKNVESAGCYTQKGIYCYLEYIEQMNRTNSLHNLDNTDAILFVYDKTLTDIYAPQGILINSSSAFESRSRNGGGIQGLADSAGRSKSNIFRKDDTHETNVVFSENGPEFNMFSNILSMNHPHTEDSNWKIMLENVGLFTKTILWMNHREFTYLQRLDLSHEHLQKWLILTFDNQGWTESNRVSKSIGTRKEGENRESTLEIMKYITTIQEKCKMEYEEYIALLESMFKLYKRAIQRNTLPSESVIREKCMVMIVYFSGKTFREIVDSDYGKSEGWKTTVDFVKWLFATSSS